MTPNPSDIVGEKRGQIESWEKKWEEATFADGTVDKANIEDFICLLIAEKEKEAYARGQQSTEYPLQKTTEYLRNKSYEPLAEILEGDKSKRDLSLPQEE